MFGRYHVVRIILGVIVILSTFTIFKSRFDKHGSHSSIQVPANALKETWMTQDAFKTLARVEETCPVCFGRDLCDEVLGGLEKGTLGISRDPIKDSENSVHPVYKIKTGKVKYWMREKLVSDQGLLSGFEEFICRNASKDIKKDIKACDVSVAAKSTFLYTSTLDLISIHSLYKAHLVSPRRIPLTLCPTYKLIRGFVEAFDENDDQTLTGEEKAVLLSTIATNPDTAIHRFVSNQKLQFPVLPFFGSCGRLNFIQGPHKPLKKFLMESLPVRVDLANQILQLVDAFIHDDPGWLFFTPDLSFDNFVVTQDENQVFLKDLSQVLLLDRDLLDSDDGSGENTKFHNKTESCVDDCFENFYDRMTSRKMEKDLNEDNLLTTSYEFCGQLMEMSGIMYSHVCRLVLSDLRAGDEHRGAKKGLLHSLEFAEAEGLNLDQKEIEILLSRCSSDPILSTRVEAALELIEIFSGDEDDGQEDSEDFNDNNMKLNDEDFHARDDTEQVEDVDSLPENLLMT